MVSTTKKTFDALVIGSGQSGTPLATALASSGRKTAIIEREHLGGCCVNEGCTPTKTMIASGRVAHVTERRVEYGVGVGVSDDGQGMVKVAMEKVRERKRAIVKSFREGSERRLKGVEGLEVMRGEARFVGHKTVRMACPGEEDREVSAEQIFINVGCRPSRPSIPGLDGLHPDHVLDSTSVMELGSVPSHLIVLGGGYIGLEFGQLFRRLGAKVTVVQRAKQLVPREDVEVAVELKKILEDEGVKVLLESEIQHLSSSSEGGKSNTCKASVRHGEDVLELRGSHLLLAAGRTPNTDSLAPGVAGIEMDGRGFIKVDDQLGTNIEGVYALGDVHGGPAFTHVSYDDFRILRANLFPPKSDKTDAAASKSSRSLEDREGKVPYVVYTDPQLGHIGFHAHEAEVKFGKQAIQTATMPMAYVARALETDESRGLMKAVVLKETGRILGFTCLGLEGGEVMSIVQTAMLGGLSYKVLQDAMYAHPTLAESLNNLWGFLK